MTMFVGRRITRTTWPSWVFIVLSYFSWSIAITEQMNFDTWKHMYCPVNTLKCYDGHCCKYGEQYCSSKSETCENVFPSGLNMEGKLSKCCETLAKNNSSSIGELSTACFFLFGSNNFPDKCNEQQITSGMFKENCAISVSEIISWVLVVILFFTVAVPTIRKIIIKWHQSKKKLDEKEDIKASSDDKNLGLQRQLSQERAALLNEGTEAPTELKQILVQGNDQHALSDEVIQTEFLQQKNKDARNDLHLNLRAAGNDSLVNNREENCEGNYRDSISDPRLNSSAAFSDLQVNSRDGGVHSSLTSKDGVIESPHTSRDGRVDSPLTPGKICYQNILFSPADPDSSAKLTPSGVCY